MIGATLVACLYAGLFGAAAIGKAIDSDGWSSLAAAVARRRSTAAALRVGLPVAEALVALLLLAAPRAGLLAAAGLLALLGAGVLAVAPRLGGTPCSCFGAMKAAPVGRGLALRNLALAGGAAAVAPAAAMAPAGSGYIVVAAAGCAVPVLAARFRRGNRQAPTPGLRLGLPGEPRLVVVLAPGCGPCGRLAPAVRSLDLPGVRVEAAVAATGDAEERRSLIDALGPRARADLADLVDDWRIPGTPFGVRLDAEGVVTAAGPVLDDEDLRALADGMLAEWTVAPMRGRSRREVLLGATGVAAAAFLAPVAQTFAAVRSAVPAQRNTPDFDIDDNPKNRFTGTCDGFADLIEKRGVIGADGDAKKKAGGYTDAAGFESASTISADVCRREERVQKTWRGFCPCDGEQYTNETQCNVDCPEGLACFGEQCQTTFRQVCIDAIVDICVAQPKITISVLRWKPTGRGAGPKCKAMAKRMETRTGLHEQHHAQDVRDAVDETNALFSNRTIRKCAEEESQARALINAEIAKLVDQAKQEAYRRDTQKSADFHRTSEGAHGRLDCRECEPAKRKKRRKR
jgi:hypothetical protein